MFIRRHYYDLTDGSTIISYMRRGNVKLGSISEDYAVYGELLGRSEQNTGCMEWTEPDEEIESGFSKASSVKVENGGLVFTMDTTPKPTYDELLAAYNILTGGNDNE